MDVGDEAAVRRDRDVVLANLTRDTLARTPGDRYSIEVQIERRRFAGMQPEPALVGRQHGAGDLPLPTGELAPSLTVCTKGVEMSVTVSFRNEPDALIVEPPRAALARPTDPRAVANDLHCL